MGAYDCAISSINSLVKYAPNVGVSVNVTMNKGIVKDYSQLINELFLLGVESIEFSPMQYSGRALVCDETVGVSPKEDIMIMKKMNVLREKWIKKGKFLFYGGRYNSQMPTFNLNNSIISCGIGSTIIIDVKGDCYFCHMTVGMKKFCGGNIFENNFADIWCGKTHCDLVNIMNVKIELCSNCHNYGNCQGGCKMSAFLATGSYESGDTSCPYLADRRI